MGPDGNYNVAQLLVLERVSEVEGLRFQIFIACIVPQTLLGITPGLIVFFVGERFESMGGMFFFRVDMFFFKQQVIWFNNVSYGLNSMSLFHQS